MKRNWLAILKLTWGTLQVLTRALKSLKNLCFNWLVWATKVQRSYFHHTEELCKFWRKTDFWFEKRLEKFEKCSLEHLKVSKLGLWWDPFVESRKGMTLKFTKQLCLMAMKNNAKFEEELHCHFKTDMRILINFDSSTQKSKKNAL